jgi:hypothetical protein
MIDPKRTFEIINNQTHATKHQTEEQAEGLGAQYEETIALME